MNINKSIIFLSIIFLFNQIFSMDWDSLKEKETQLQSELNIIPEQIKIYQDKFDPYTVGALKYRQSELEHKLGKLRGQKGNLFKEAVRIGDEKTVKELISKGADVNYQPDEYYDTALTIAAKKGHYNIAKDLIEAGADLNAANFQGIGPLESAAFENHKNIIELLIDSGADIYFPSFEFRARDGEINFDIIEFIRNKIKEKIFKITLRPISELKDDKLKLFIEKQQKELEKLIYEDVGIGTIDIKDAKGYNPVHNTIVVGNFELAKWLLSKDSSLITKQNNAGVTPLELGFGLWENSNKFFEFLDDIKKAEYVTDEEIKKVQNEFLAQVAKEEKEAREEMEALAK